MQHRIWVSVPVVDGRPVDVWRVVYAGQHSKAGCSCGLAVSGPRGTVAGLVDSHYRDTR